MYGVTETVITLLQFLVGTTLLVADPTSPFQVLPVVVGVALLVHAISRDEVRRIEYTIVGL